MNSGAAATAHAVAPTIVGDYNLCGKRRYCQAVHDAIAADHLNANENLAVHVKVDPQRSPHRTRPLLLWRRAAHRKEGCAHRQCTSRRQLT